MCDNAGWYENFHAESIDPERFCELSELITKVSEWCNPVVQEDVDMIRSTQKSNV